MTFPLVYSKRELKEFFDFARKNDVDNGGRYDARSAAINVWSANWLTEENKTRSEIVCTFYFDWVDNCLYKIESERSEEDGLTELGKLELAVLGRAVNGR